MKSTNVTPVKSMGMAITFQSSNKNAYPIIYSDDEWAIARDGTKLKEILGQAGTYTQEEIDEKIAQYTIDFKNEINEYVANLERRGDVLGIKKVYKTKAEMDADVAAPVGTDGKVLRFGQLASVWDGGNATSADNGMVYAWQGADKPWLAVGKLNSTYVMVDISSDEYDKLVAEGKVDENTYYNILEE